MIDVRPVVDGDAAGWDEIARTSDDAWLTHTWEWNAEIEERVQRAHRRSLVVLRGGRLVGILPLHLRVERRGVWSRRILFSNCWAGGGLALANDLTPEVRRECFAVALRATHQQARRDRVDKLILMGSPLARRALRREGTRLRAVDGRFADRSTIALVVPLSGRTVDDVWAGMEGRSRTKARKAGRAGARVVRSSGPEAVASFYELHLATHRRTGSNPRPREYFEALLSSPHYHAFFAEREGRRIAASIVALYGGRALYLASASIDEGLQLGANNLLQWHAMRWLIESGVEAYEIGMLPDGASANDRKLNAIAYYLRSFGGDEVPAYRAELVYDRRREAAFSLARQIAVGIRDARFG